MKCYFNRRCGLGALGFFFGISLGYVFLLHGQYAKFKAINMQQALLSRQLQLSEDLVSALPTYRQQIEQLKQQVYSYKDLESLLITLRRLADHAHIELTRIEPTSQKGVAQLFLTADANFDEWESFLRDIAKLPLHLLFLRQSKTDTNMTVKAIIEVVQ